VREIGRGKDGTTPLEKFREVSCDVKKERRGKKLGCIVVKRQKN